MTKFFVGISAGRKYENYLKWITQDTDVGVIKLSYEEKNFDRIAMCQGIVLSGGEDVHPKYYGKPEYVKEYGLDDLDEKRDEFEWRVLDHVRQTRLPLLGICRGLQLANVYFGGTLVPDIVAAGKPDHTKFQEGKDRQHQIRVSDHSFLKEITRVDAGIVNSAHHQCAAIIGKDLVVNALSDEDIVEGLELKDHKAHPFLLLVQWHPERMTPESPLAKNIRERFLMNIKKA